MIALVLRECDARGLRVPMSVLMDSGQELL